MQPDDAPVFLNRLTLDQLRDFAASLQGLANCGDVLDGAAFAPVFDLTPGLPVSIHLDFVMPTDPRAGAIALITGFDMASGPDWTVISEPAQPEQTPSTAGQGGDSGGGADGSAASPAAPELPVASDVEPPESARQDAQEQPDGADEPRPVGLPLDVTPPSPAPAGPITPGSVRALAVGTPPRWTEDEDSRAIDIAVELLTARHHTPMQLAEIIGPALGRPVDGTCYRIRTKLMDRITDARLHATATAPASPAPAPLAAAAEDTLTAHLKSLPMKNDWTMAHDRELVQLAVDGWDTPSIAMEMQVSGDFIKARFAQLTRRAHEDPAMRFTREAVLARLKLLAPVDA